MTLLTITFLLSRNEDKLFQFSQLIYARVLIRTLQFKVMLFKENEKSSMEIHKSCT